MPNNSVKPKYYFDSGLFLCLVNQEEGRYGTVETLMVDAQKGEIEIFTSILSRCEVVYAEEEKQQAKLSEETYKRINSLWHPSAPIHLVEVYSLIVEDAYNLARKAKEHSNFEWSLKPADSIHLATAKRMQVDKVFSYDKGLYKFDVITGFKIEEPASLSMELPSGDAKPIEEATGEKATI